MGENSCSEHRTCKTLIEWSRRVISGISVIENILFPYNISQHLVLLTKCYLIDKLTLYQLQCLHMYANSGLCPLIALVYNLTSSPCNFKVVLNVCHAIITLIFIVLKPILITQSIFTSLFRDYITNNSIISLQDYSFHCTYKLAR